MIEAMKQALEALESHIVWFSRDTMIGKSMRENANKAITSLRQAIAEAEKQEPVAWACWLDSENPETDKPTVVNYEPLAYSKRRPLLYAHPPKRVVFPTMLRKMWSGAEVQAWLDEHLNK